MKYNYFTFYQNLATFVRNILFVFRNCRWKLSITSLRPTQLRRNFQSIPLFFFIFTALRFDIQKSLGIQDYQVNIHFCILRYVLTLTNPQITAIKTQVMNLHICKLFKSNACPLAN